MAMLSIILQLVEVYLKCYLCCSRHASPAGILMSSLVALIYKVAISYEESVYAYNNNTGLGVVLKF